MRRISARVNSSLLFVSALLLSLLLLLLLFDLLLLFLLPLSVLPLLVFCCFSCAFPSVDVTLQTPGFNDTVTVRVAVSVTVILPLDCLAKCMPIVRARLLTVSLCQTVAKRNCFIVLSTK